jgi:xylan 1,4-beta-xylosidase
MNFRENLFWSPGPHPSPPPAYRRRGFVVLFVALVLLATLATQARAQLEFPVTLRIDASQTRGKFEPFWRFFGYDECNFTYMKFGQELLGELGQLGSDQVYIRCHHLLTSGDGSPGMKWGSTGIYHVDASGQAVYDFTIVDRIFDTYLIHGVKPYVQLGFMPKDLSTRPDLYPTQIDPNVRVPADAGQAYPPKDYGRWRELIRQWVMHCVQRYGQAEVAQWYFEVWNEPDISYWKGTPEEYYKLYDYAVDGVRGALPGARVGGPEAAGNDRWLRGFLEHCLHGTNYATRATGSPLDFVSFHAKGSPAFVDGHVRTGLAHELGVISRNFAAIASFPELKNIPVVIGECDPDGMAARPVSEAPALGYRNTTLFASYTAAAFGRIRDLADQDRINLRGALTWSFEFENKPYFAGFRTLASNGIDLPVMNVFRMFAKMGGERLAVEDSADLGLAAMIHSPVREKPDVYAVASLLPGKLCVMVWHYADDDVPGAAAAVEIDLTGLPAELAGAKVTEYRIDQDHSDAYAVWKQMGSPQNPTVGQYVRLQQAGKLAMNGIPRALTAANGSATIHVDLPRQAVSLFVIESP